MKRLKEEEEATTEVYKTPISSIYEEIKTILRGKTPVDYKDEYETIFGIIINSVVEIKFNKTTDNLIVRFYVEPKEDQKLNLATTDYAIDFQSKLPHILAENSVEVSTLISYYKVVPDQDIKKVILQDHNITSYKELLNFGYSIFKDSFGL